MPELIPAEHGTPEWHAARRVFDTPVKAHTRHVDGLWRVKQQGDDSE
jgi:hypothetical protein